MTNTSLTFMARVCMENPRTRDLLLNRTDDKLKDMTMVADLSHWINVAETDCNDPDLG